MKKKSDNSEKDNKSSKNVDPSPQDKPAHLTTRKKLRCINIDCVFNSARNPRQERNTCNHPNLKIESRIADITIAICSEFRSKKDYKFEKPSTLIELKSGSKEEIKGQPGDEFTHVEKVTTEELEQEIERDKVKEKLPVKEQEVKTTKSEQTIYETPVVVTARKSKTYIPEPFIPVENKYSDFQVLKRLYQPYLRRGMTFSIIAHLVLIWFIYLFLVGKDERNDSQQQQRLVVVEDIETPKFEPPNVDKIKEESNPVPGDINKDVRPKITPKNITPRIKRPKIQSTDTTDLAIKHTFDSTRIATDSLLAALTKGDTSRILIPDSLKNFMPDNAIGLKLWYPKNWKLTDNRSVNLNLEQFKGVILNTDSASDDPGAVSMFIQIDDPKHSTYNKTVFKNIFAMDDSLSTAFSTDPQVTGAKRITYKFFIFTDPTGQSNIYVNSETKQEMFDKYRKYIEAIVRSIQIAPKLSGSETKK